MNTMYDSKQHDDDVEFIMEHLLPEMVHDRCFCESGSREFVQFLSAQVDGQPRLITVPFDGLVCCVYSATLTVAFSGDPTTFAVVIKLPPKSVHLSPAFAYFLTEEYFYTKMSNKITTNIIPKCYLSNLGKYGRPVIVLENLLKNNFQNVDRMLTSEEMKLCLRKLGQFHAAGLKVKEAEPDIFREFDANVYKIQLDHQEKEKYNGRWLRELRNMRNLTVDEIERKLGSNPFDSLQTYNSNKFNKLRTVCHGNLKCPNLFFKYVNNVVTDVKFDHFESIKMSSIGLHLTTFLLLNGKTLQIGTEETDSFIQSYMDGLKQIYATNVSIESVKKDIEAARAFSYVNVLALTS